MSNLAANLTSTAAASPQAPALRLGDVIVTFAELEEQAARVAAVLDSRGVGVGDRVAMMLPNVLTRDEEGYYRIVDRKKDLILRGGYNVYPREVEEVLHRHPSVAEAAVVGVPHDSLGEEVAAAVALKPGKEATPEELTEFVRDRIAAYKYPRHVWIVDALPKSATGKILRREVRATTHAEI
jgi:acyl-CoA synthetase (AMP-forming)/AMP-acid ligase II